MTYVSTAGFIGAPRECMTIEGIFSSIHFSIVMPVVLNTNRNRYFPAKPKM